MTTIGLFGSIAANKLEITGTTTGFANGTEVNILIRDIEGNSTSVTAVIQGNSFVVANIDTTQFTAGNLTLTATAGDTLAQDTAELLEIPSGDPIVIPTQPVLNGANKLTILGKAPSLKPNDVLNLVVRDTSGTSVTTTAVVQADRTFSVTGLSTQGLQDGLLVIDVTAQANGQAISVVNAANVTLSTLTPLGSDKTLQATEDVGLAVLAADFGYSNTDGFSMTGVKIAGLPGQGTLKFNGVAVVMDQFVSLADLNAGKLVFQGAANANGTNYANFKFKVLDTRPTNNEDLVANTITLNVAAVNDAPVNTVPLAQTTPEDTDKVITGLSVLDVDATGSITVTLGVTNGTLALLAGTGVTLAGNNSTSVTLTGTQGAINTLLATANAVTYKPTANFNGSATLSMISSDGSLTDTDTVAINVTAVNDAPVLATGSTLSYTENNIATAINTVITVADADSTALALGTVSITGGYVTGQDVLSFANTGAAAMGNISGSFNGTTGVMTLTSVSNSATLAQWQAALRAVAYSNTSDAPSTAARTVSYVVKDGALNSAVVTSTINVTAVNDAPVNTVPLAQTTPEDTDKVITGLSVLDVDATGSITVTLGVTNGTMALLAGTGVTLASNNSTSVTLTGTQGAINTLLATANAVTYKPTANFNGSATLSMISSDGTLTDTDTVAINVTAVNDAPVLADTNLNLATVDPVTGNPTGAVGNLVSSLMGGVSDVDAGALQGLAITGVDTTQGKLWYSTNGGSTWTEVTQTLSNTNALLIGSDADNRLYFKPLAGAPDGQVSAALTFRAWDQTTGSEGNYVSTTPNGTTTAFSTGVDTVGQTIFHDKAPTLVGSNPSDNSYLMAVGNDLVLNFSENVVRGTGLIELYNANGTLVQSFDAATSGLVTGWGTANLTINPTNDLLFSTGYHIKIAPTAVKDLGGNTYAGIADATTLNFITSNGDGSITPTATSGIGYVVSSAGDVNGDGFDDVIVGAPTLRNEPYTGSFLAGGAYVIYGNAAGTLPALPMDTNTGVNSSINPSLGFKISTGLKLDSRLGATVSGIGDINGDGFDDVMMGGGGTAARAYVVYGGAINTGVSINAAGDINNSQGFEIALTAGTDSTGNFGSVVTGLGDVNGDGLSDFGLKISNFHSYVIYGNATNQSDLVANALNTYAIDPSRGYLLAGLVTAVGDMNNDGIADVVATTFNSTNSTNSTYAAAVYYSNANGTANTTNVAYKITGDISNSPMSQVTSMGDVNGDGISDLAVLSSRKSYVVYGQTGTTNVALSTLSASQGFEITPSGGSSSYDWISSAGDVNGDGLADLIMGKQNTGVNFAIVVYGNASGTDVQITNLGAGDINDDNIAASQGFRISSTADGRIGYRVSNAGDFNGDGLADLIVGGVPTQHGVFGIVLGGTQFVTNAVQGSGTVTGTSGSEALFGSTANDTLTGGGGVDRFFAGEGNDTIVLTATDVTNLANVTTGQTVKATIDGGGGFDTLRLTGGANLNLTTISNVGATSLEENSRIERIERIDLATDTAANTLTISSRDIKDMAGFNRIHTGLASEDGKIWTNTTGTALSTTTRYHQMVVEATAADSVVLAADVGGWVNVGSVSNGTSAYNVYQNNSTNTQIIVGQGAAVDLPPSLVGSNPSDNGFLTAVGNDLVLNFSEAVAKGTGLIELFNANGTLVQSFDVVSSGLVTGWGTANLTINPTNNLLASTGYYIRIAPTAVQDTAGNAYAGITNNTTLNFTTADASGAIVVPVNGIMAIEDLSTIGDFNGDGYDDFIVGAGMNGLSSTGGAAFVVYGNANGIVPNLSAGSIAASAGFKIVSGQTGDYLGIAVNSAGDTNGDGLADLVVTAKYGDASSRESAYVVFGKSNASSVFATGLNVGTGFTASMGYQLKLDESYWGHAVSNAGDVNGDGLSDLLVTSDANTGREVFVIYGKTGNQSITLTSYTQFTPDLGYNVLSTNGTDLGRSVYGAGDVNGDGLADFIVGAPNSTTGQRGMVYVVYGNSTGTSVQLNATDGIAASQGFRILGDTGNNSSYSRFGFAVSSAGDVNGDGLADVMIGSPYQPGTVGGAVYVVYGNSSGNVLDIDLANNSGLLAASRGFQISSALVGDFLGPYGKDVASAGDINGDGLSDMIISGRDDNGSTAASTYVVYGNASGTNVAIDASGNIAASNGFKLKGAVGFAVASAGDINGDGLNDLLVSARLSGVSGSYNVVLGGTQWVTAALDGAGTFAGTSGSEALIGSAGNDTITGGGGVDRFFAGRGDDTIVLTASDIANLQNNSTGQTAKTTVSGGTGFDTIRLSGGASLDLLKVSNAAAMGIDETSRIEGIERIDMATDTAANVLNVSNKDVNDMAGFNQIHTGSASVDGKTWTNVSGSALSNITRYHQMVVDGGSNDTVALTANGGAWSNVGVVSNGTTQYTVYQNTATNSQVLVQQGVTVDTQAPTLLWSTPADNDYVNTANLGNNITLQFSENVVKGNGFIQLWNKTTGQPVQAFDVSSSTLVTGWGTSTLTINPTANLAAATDYFIKISDNAIQDNSGLAYSGMNSDLQLNFSTQSADNSYAVPSSFTSASSTSSYLRSVATAGDFNGDGYDDLLVGVAGSTQSGVYVIYGNALGEGLNLDKDPVMSNGVIAADQGFKIHGADYLGTSVSGIGDVNGDGFADVLISAPSDSQSGSNAGAAFVVYGSAAPAALNLSSGTIAAARGFKITAGSAYSSLGDSVSGVGDMNGDGINDFVIGYAGANFITGGGAAYVVYGKTNATSLTFDTNGSIAAADGFRLTGGVNENAGFSVSGAGDVNGDGLADVIVSANGALSNADGATYVIFGGATGGDMSALLAAGKGFKITGLTNSTGYQLGTSVSSAGDVNGDGYADLIVATDTDQSYTAAYVVYGGAAPTNVSLAASTMAAAKGFRILGNCSNGAGLGQVSGAGDLNGDGFADVIVGSTNGSSYVVYGKATGAEVSVSTGTIAASQGFKLTYSTNTTSTTAKAVSFAGDFDGDGLTDLVIAEATDFGNSQTYKIVFGGTQWLTTPVIGNGTVTGTAASEAILGSASNDTLSGGGGVDRFFAGKGNDTIVLSATDVVNLAENTVAAAKASVNGGSGFDTLQLSGGANLNLTAISNVGALGWEENSRIESIERIDLATDTAANTLTLTARDVNDMAGFNLIRTGSVSADGKTWTNVSGTALSAITKFHQLVVDGTSFDSVSIKSTTGTWTNAGTVNDGTSDFVVWQNTATASQLMVKSGVTVTANVAPVVLDLNRDGELSYANVVMDVNSDGVMDNTLWAGKQDGVLVWDKYHDGQVHNHSQYAFTLYGGSTDLEGLAAGFDTNHDGVFNAQDANFGEFKVWQDANQNGVSDAGEVRNLADWGIASINLSSDGVVRAPAVGVQEAGRSTAQLADGGQMLVADAAFEFQTVPQLDLAGFVAQAQAESKAQPLPAQASVKLFLYDMIQGATAAEQGIGALFAAEGEGLSAPEPLHLGFHMDLLAEHLLQPPQS